MPSEIFEMPELSQRILRLLWDGMQTIEPTKSQAELSATEIATRLSAAPHEVQEQLNLLDGLGYVDHVQSFGGDPTVSNRHIPIESAIEDPLIANSYYISAVGKQVLLPMLTEEQESAPQPGM
jgi:hypothetical protein